MIQIRLAVDRDIPAIKIFFDNVIIWTFWTYICMSFLLLQSQWFKSSHKKKCKLSTLCTKNDVSCLKVVGFGIRCGGQTSPTHF